MNRILIVVFTFCAFDASLSEETPQDGLLVFETDILPILETRCLACHEGEKAKYHLSFCTPLTFNKY